MNEFGPSLGLESSVLRTASGDDAGAFVELAGGCLCCTVKSGLLQALEALLARPGPGFTHVLVETSGLADPGPVAVALWADDAAEPAARLDAVVCVLDATDWPRSLGQPHAPEAANQVAAADVVVLNKASEAGAAACAAGEAAARALNPAAAFVRADRCEVSLTDVLGLGALRWRAADGGGGEGSGGEGEVAAGGSGDGGESASAAAAAAGEEAAPRPPPPRRADRWRSPSLPAPHGGAGGGGPLRRPGAPGPGGGVGWVLLTAARAPISEPAFVAWLEELLWNVPEGAPCPLLRAKGVLCCRLPESDVGGGGDGGGDGAAPARLQGEPLRRVLQAVRDTFEVCGGGAWAAGEERATRVLLIGRGLDGQALRAAFAAAVGE